jgi:hypothetical protein
MFTRTTSFTKISRARHDYRQIAVVEKNQGFEVRAFEER